LFACRQCDFSEEADASCVYRNVIKHSEGYVFLIEGFM
jgi:hypothetical protein